MYKTNIPLKWSLILMDASNQINMLLMYYEKSICITFLNIYKNKTCKEIQMSDFHNTSFKIFFFYIYSVKINWYLIIMLKIKTKIYAYNEFN